MDAFQKVNKASALPYGTNAFLTRINGLGSGLAYSTYIGGTGVNATADFGSGIAVDNLGNAYLTGTAFSDDFPTSLDAFQKVNKTAPSGGSGTVFVSKFLFHGVTTTALTSHANPQASGDAVTFTASVAGIDSQDTPTGVVTFGVDGHAVDNVTLDGSGHASYSSASLPIGPHTITASFSGDLDAHYSPSSASLTETISGQIPPPSFPRIGGTYISPVQVQIAATTLGAVIYYTTDGSTPSPTTPAYKVPVTVSGPSTTVKAIAVENGLTTSAISTSVYRIIPGAIPTNTTLKSLSNPSILGDPVTFQATVTAASGPTPTGTVFFKNGGVIVGSAALANGVATFSISDLSLYGHSIAAAYTGSSTNESSAASITQEVSQ